LYHHFFNSAFLLACDIMIFSNGISRLFQTDFFREISGTSYGFRALKLMKQGLIRARYQDSFNWVLLFPTSGSLK